MNLYIIIAILVGHYVGDFVTQQNNHKINRTNNIYHKIKRYLKHIYPHTLIYSGILTGLLLILQIFNLLPFIHYINILWFFIITYISHLLTDLFVTLVVNKHLLKNKRHKYFVTIGFDQLIHYITLFLTIYFLWYI
jgi:hypothetical protein